VNVFGTGITLPDHSDAHMQWPDLLITAVCTVRELRYQDTPISQYFYLSLNSSWLKWTQRQLFMA